ncbi:MAG: S8 family serine peptidase [Gemmatimonadota bacterium]|jgi:subtilisin
MSKARLITATMFAFAALAGCDDPARPGLDDKTRPGMDDASLAQRQQQVIPDRYIVVFKDDVTDPGMVARGLAHAHGLGLRHTYSAALKGFAAVVPAGRLHALRADPRVRSVTPDRLDAVHQQGLPTGIDRIEADQNTSATASDPVDVDIAILDTGIDLDHPDLDVFQAVSFAGGNPDDGMGHGTHVAGTAAAKDDGVGVVGVAPGARLWAVKVCNNGGSCSRSDIIAGIDYVAQHGREIEVANMSIGGVGSDDGACGTTDGDAEHQAICAAVDSGVVFVVSAGNSDYDAAHTVPAAYDEVLTVSALADFDGRPGGLAAPTCTADEDDSRANFSNYGPDVDLMAPGVCIESTWKQGGFNTISGTSMAAPHVTGTVALYAARNYPDGLSGRADVESTMSHVVEAGIDPQDACGLAVFDDPDGIPEPIVFANAANVGGDGRCATAPAGRLDVAVLDVTPPPFSDPGQTIAVGVLVQNAGAVDVTDLAVILVSDNATPDVSDDITIDTLTIQQLAPGLAAELSFLWNTSGASSGAHALTAVQLLDDDDPTNDSATAGMTITSTVHVGDLDRSSDPPAKGKWTAYVRVTVHDADEAPVTGAEVSGTWTSPDGKGSCVTGTDGRCEISLPDIKKGSQFQVWFTVDDVVAPGLAYDATANHDPDGNSDGTVIEVLDENPDDYRSTASGANGGQ